MVTDFAQAPMLGNSGDQVAAVDRAQICQTGHDLTLVANTLSGTKKRDGEGEGDAGVCQAPPQSQTQRPDIKHKTMTTAGERTTRQMQQQRDDEPHN